MRIVAMNALIPQAWAAGEIPVSVHAPVAPVVVGATRRTVTLGTQGHGFCHRDGFARRETKAERFSRLVTCRAGKSSVCELETLVKRAEFICRASRLSGIDLRMTGLAADAGWFPCVRERIGLDRDQVLRGGGTHFEDRFARPSLKRVRSIVIASDERAATRSRDELE